MTDLDVCVVGITIQDLVQYVLCVESNMKHIPNYELQKAKSHSVQKIKELYESSEYALCKAETMASAGIPN